jgi:hypothetical protein
MKSAGLGSSIVICKIVDKECSFSNICPVKIILY